MTSNKNSGDKLSRKGMSGHSGIAINNDYYDYGPTPQHGGDLFGSPARPWWDSQIPGVPDATLQDILSHLNGPGALGETNEDVYTVTFYVNHKQAEAVRSYWQYRYHHLGYYRFYGRQCTTAVERSLERANLFRHETLKPGDFFKRLMDQARNMCGDRKDKPATTEMVRWGHQR